MRRYTKASGALQLQPVINSCILQIQLRWQNQNMKTFTRWPVVVVISFTALWDQTFLEPLYIIWPPPTLLKGFLNQWRLHLCFTFINVILHSFTGWKLDCMIRKVENANQEGGKLKTAMHQKCERQELFPLPQHLFLFCQLSDTALSHSFCSFRILLCQKYPEDGYWK